VDDNWAVIRIEAGGAMSIGFFDTATTPHLKTAVDRLLRGMKTSSGCQA
jgi:hypothetical protein